MNWKYLAIAFVIVTSGCVSTEQLANTRPNRNVDTNRMVGPESSEWDTPPKLIKGKAPVYPISQLLTGGTGISVIVYTIGTDGKPKDFKVESAGDEKYANHAIIALKEWVFQPAKKDGVPVEASVRQEFVYTR